MSHSAINNMSIWVGAQVLRCPPYDLNSLNNFSSRERRKINDVTVAMSDRPVPLKTVPIFATRVGAKGTAGWVFDLVSRSGLTCHSQAAVCPPGWPECSSLPCAQTAAIIPCRARHAAQSSVRSPPLSIAHSQTWTPYNSCSCCGTGSERSSCTVIGASPSQPANCTGPE